MKIRTPEGVRHVAPPEVSMGKAPMSYWTNAVRQQQNKSKLKDARGLSGQDLTRANDPANVVAEMMFASYSGQPHRDVKRGPDVGRSSVKTVFDVHRRLQSPEYHLHNGVESLVLIRYDHDTGEFFYRGWVSVDEFLDNAIESDGGNPNRPPILRLENRYLNSGLPSYQG
jgi:hypothetical protein